MLPNTAAHSAHIEKYHFVDFQSLVIWDPWRTGITDVVRESAYHVIGLKTRSLWVTLTSIPGLHSYPI